MENQQIRIEQLTELLVKSQEALYGQSSENRRYFFDEDSGQISLDSKKVQQSQYSRTDVNFPGLCTGMPKIFHSYENNPVKHRIEVSDNAYRFIQKTGFNYKKRCREHIRYITGYGCKSFVS